MFSRLAGALLLSIALIMTVQAQEQRYVEDTRAVPLREHNVPRAGSVVRGGPAIWEGAFRRRDDARAGAAG